VGRKADRDRALLERMVVLSRENPHYGYRRVWALLRREGWPANKKRVHRLWRKEGLKVPEGKQRKRRRLPIFLGTSDNSCTRKRATHQNHVWSYDDFVMDLTEDGRRLKMMPIVDEYSRECLSIDVERSITAEDVIETLATLFRRRGESIFIRSDNGPEFVAKAIKRWLEASGVKTLYIEPGSPWENAYSETFISRFSDELLKRELFADLLEAKVLVEDYREHYNHDRPHSALGYQTPAQFTEAVDLDRKVEGAWQAKADEGFDVANFRIDWEKKTVTCPQERQSIRWSKTKTARGRKMIHVGFAPEECAACTSRPLCTRAKNLPPAPSPCSHEKSTRPSSRQKASENRGFCLHLLSQSGHRRNDLARSKGLRVTPSSLPGLGENPPPRTCHCHSG
jgi:putative transposase